MIVSNECKNIKNNICVIKQYNKEEWDYKGIVIGSKTPLYKFVIALAKMNMINFSKDIKGTNIDELFDTK